MARSSSKKLVEMRGIEKRFGRVVALDGVNLELRNGEVLGLLGDNGSGKSTLVKTLVGVHQPDGGEIYIKSEKRDIQTPKDARELGIATVYQNLALVDTMTVAANMFLARHPMKRLGGVLPIVDWEEMNQRAEAILRERMNLSIDPTARVEFLSGGERQAIAIARALVTDPDIIVMDEPTSALSAESTRRVQELIKTLQEEEGISIIVISHNLDEVFELTDRVTVLLNGNLVSSVDSDSVSKNDIVTMMVDGTMSGEQKTGTSASP
jgi:simple sugar transport system ATP-binding protein